ncbi:NAD-binding protein [bacterium]|nr:NAD-binding protein [bacterium]MBU1959050.1 NAD-binding protein [bacterium]
MSHRTAFMFGYGKSTYFVAQELFRESLHLSIIVNDEVAFEEAKNDGYVDVTLLDITDDTLLESLNVNEEDYLICVMKDNHLNVFLTLSLHNLFPNNMIVALSDSIHTTQKLKMAGANKIIDVYNVSANRVYNILHKPVTTQLIERLLSSDEMFSFKEMQIPKNSCLDGVMVDDFDFREHNIILVGMIDQRLSDQFLFITSGLEHRFDSGDTIVCIGYNDDLEKFEAYMKGVE